MPLLVDPDEVARRLGLEVPLDAATLARVEDAISDAQADVQGFLGRPLVAETVTLTGLWADAMWPLTDKRAWPQAREYLDDRYRVVSSVVNAVDADRFDVTFLVGLDVAGDPDLEPIRRFIRAAAVEGLRRDATFTAAGRAVTSVSAGGQSVSYEGAAGEGAAGGVPTLASLKRWKRRAIRQPAARPFDPWPYAYRS